MTDYGVIRTLRSNDTQDVPTLWRTYGLTIVQAVRFTASDDEFREIVRDHWAVALYLDAHPDVAARYETDQSGDIKYYDVLRLAGRREEGE